jgi:hypothetical protein
MTPPPAAISPGILAMLDRMASDSDRYVRHNIGRSKSSPSRAVVQSTTTFFKSYFWERGIWRGTEGLVTSVYQAQTVFWSHLLLYEAATRGGTAGREGHASATAVRP